MYGGGERDNNSVNVSDVGLVWGGHRTDTYSTYMVCLFQNWTDEINFFFRFYSILYNSPLTLYFFSLLLPPSSGGHFFGNGGGDPTPGGIEAVGGSSVPI